MVGNTVRARGRVQAWEFDSSTFRKQGEGMNAVSNGDRCPSKREVEVISEWRDGAYQTGRPRVRFLCAVPEEVMNHANHA